MSPWSRLFVIPCSVLRPLPRGQSPPPTTAAKSEKHVHSASLAARLAQLLSRGHQRRSTERKSLAKQGMRELGPLYSFGHKWVAV